MMCLISDSLTTMFPDLFSDFFLYLAYKPKLPYIYIYKYFEKQY